MSTTELNIFILGRMYKVVRVPEGHPALGPDESGGPYVARHSPFERKIYLVDKQHPNSLKESLIHEIIHAILHATGHDLPESVIDALATGVKDLIEQNGELLTYMRSNDS